MSESMKKGDLVKLREDHELQKFRKIFHGVPMLMLGTEQRRTGKFRQTDLNPNGELYEDVTVVLGPDGVSRFPTSYMEKEE